MPCKATRKLQILVRWQKTGTREKEGKAEKIV